MYVENIQALIVVNETFFNERLRNSFYIWSQTETVSICFYVLLRAPFALVDSVWSQQLKLLCFWARSLLANHHLMCVAWFDLLLITRMAQSFPALIN